MISELCDCGRWISVQLTIFVYVMLNAGAVQAEAPVTAMCMAPDGKQVLMGSQRGIDILSWPDMKLISTWTPELAQIHDLSFSPDGEILLAAGGAPAEDGVVEMLQWPERKSVRRVSVHADVVYRVAWAADGKQWASASADGTCAVFDRTSADPLRRWNGHSAAVLSICFLKDLQSRGNIASAGTDQTIQVWDSESSRLVRKLDNHIDSVLGIAVRPKAFEEDVTVIASVSADQTVRIWQPSTGRLIRFVRLPSVPRAVVWSARGDRLYAGCSDGKIRVIDADRASIVHEISAFPGRIHELAVSPDQQHLLVAGQLGFRVIDISDESLSGESGRD